MAEYMKLQNGSDVRGIASEGIEGEHINLTPEAAFDIARAFAKWLANKKKRNVESLEIGIGHDSRITADVLTNAAAEGMSKLGVHVYNCGLVSTPSMFMTTVLEGYEYDGAIMVTASHLPFNRNGLKFFDTDGGLEHEDITDVLKIAEEIGGKDISAAIPDQCTEVNSIDAYCDYMKSKIINGVKAEIHDKPLAGLHVVVDAGNGAAGFFVEKILKPLGADTTGSQFLEPDGMFPNHIPNPENKKAMDAIRNAVLDSKADLGIIFDTDVDRMSAVLSDGTEVNRDAIIAMMAAIIAKDYPGGTVVTDSVTSDRLTRFLEDELGMKHHRFMRGYKNVINESIRLNKAGVVSPLAIETSGHGALSENYFLDDGAYMAVKILIALALAKRDGKKLASYIDKLPAGVEEREYRYKIKEDNFKAYGQEVLKAFEQRAREKGYHVVPNSYEGIRLSFQTEEVGGWVLLRLSLHDPQMPLNIEGNKVGDCDKLFKIVTDLLDGFDKLTI